MAQPNATIEQGSENAKRMEDSLRKGQEAPPRMIGDMNAAREVKFYIYVYNVGPIEHHIARPWAHITPSGKEIVIPACKPGKPYGEPLLIPDVVQEKTFVSGSNEFGTRGVDGKFLAQDALNPDDPTGSWKSVRPINQGLTTNIGTNLYNFGCFWTLANPPEPEAVAKAKERLTEYANAMIVEANNMHIQKRDNEIGFVHRKMAEYLGVETEWHQVYSAKIACPGCGEAIKDGIAMCPHCSAVFDEKRAKQLYPNKFKS
jgi:hypothetical protein